MLGRGGALSLRRQLLLPPPELVSTQAGLAAHHVEAAAHRAHRSVRARPAAACRGTRCAPRA